MTGNIKLDQAVIIVEFNREIYTISWLLKSCFWDTKSVGVYY